MPVFLGLDIGTTSTIGLLADDGDRILATAKRAVELSSPNPGWAEEDPGQWWANVSAIVPELLEKSGCQAGDISAVGVTGMVPAVVLLDKSQQLLRPSIQQSDGRSSAEVAEIKEEMDPAYFLQLTGNGINQQLVANKLRWIERHENDVFKRIATVFGSYDFINWKLTGNRFIEQNWALEAGFLSLETRNLAPDLIALGHIDPAVLPPPRASHEIIGTVNREASSATGLAEGTPVIAGCADHVASAYVAGVIDARRHPDQVRRRRRYPCRDQSASTRRPAVYRFPHRPGPLYAKRLHGHNGIAVELVRCGIRGQLPDERRFVIQAPTHASMPWLKKYLRAPMGSLPCLIFSVKRRPSTINRHAAHSRAKPQQRHRGPLARPS